MTLRQYLETHDPAEQKAKEEVWARAADILTGADLDHVRTTVENECRLPELAWEDLFAALDAATAANVPAAMTQVFQDRILHGPEIEETPAPKGRAVDANRFLKWLDDQGIFASPSAQRRFLDDVKSDSSPAPPSHQQLRLLCLGQHLIWATFHEEMTDPFAEWETAREVRDALELAEPAQPDDQKLFLLVYRVPEDIPVRYPTIADAYATRGEWNPNFQCSPPEAPWGYTSGNAPEVVHDEVQGECLIDPDADEADSVTAVRIAD